MDSNTQQSRTVVIADHLWKTFENMAFQMGTDRDALINQAMFMFAQGNGFFIAEHQTRPDRTTLPGMPGNPAAPHMPPQTVAETLPFPERAVHDAKQTLEGSNSEDRLVLHMVLADGVSKCILKDRFLIGRDHHCDFVIESSKISREHATLVRVGGEYFIEDLGSSNGTWYHKQRIQRRKITEGDEYFFCNEKVVFVYRPGTT